MVTFQFRRLSESQFDIICNETLDSLAERFEDIADNLIERDFDVTFAVCCCDTINVCWNR